MVEALNIRELNSTISNRYERDETRIVGIMFARYDLPLTQAIVDSCYSYWHENTGKTIDFFWAGYGKYLCPDDESSDRIILKFAGNDTRVYYDKKAFISIKNKFNDIFKQTYKDRIELVLVNYRDGKLRYNESIKIDLEEQYDTNLSTIRELVEFITNECSAISDLRELNHILRGERWKKYIKYQIHSITLSDVISIVTGLMGLQFLQ